MPKGTGRYGGYIPQQAQEEPGNRLLEFMPVVIGALIAAHLLAFAYWIYRVAVEKQTPRRKVN